jgi:tetratricopeptide (TPR) repeat protein
VVVGYDLERAEVILRSGERQRLLRPMANFERTWQRAGGWGMLVSPANEIPPGISQEAFVRALQSLQQASSTDLSQTLRQATQRWPRNFVLRMGLANAIYKQARYAEAEQAFRAAIALSPQRAEAWNNLAYALAAQQRKDEALQAVEQAIALQPQNAEYQRSRTEIAGWP